MRRLRHLTNPSFKFVQATITLDLCAHMLSQARGSATLC